MYGPGGGSETIGGIVLQHEATSFTDSGPLRGWYKGLLLILWFTESVPLSGVTSAVPGPKLRTICERSVHPRIHTTKLAAEDCHIVV